MSTLAEMLIKVGVDADELESGFQSAVSSVEDNIGKITAVTAVAGGALEGFARSQAPLRESAARLAAATGEDADEISRLAREASNVTFPLDEAFASMEVGRQQGLKSGEQLQDFATFWDMVGDATGESGPALAKAGVALRAVGIEAGNEAEALGALGFITRETTSSVNDFLGFLDRTGPELRELGADVDDAAAIMGVLESELGMSGRTARTEFRSAINESDGTLGGLLDTLGITGDQFDAYTKKVGASSGVISENADIHADSFTAMQKAQHWASELMNEYSGLFDMASTLALPLMALGPVMGGVIKLSRGMFKAGKFAGKGLLTIGKAAGKGAVAVGKAAGRMAAAFARMVAQAAMATARVVAQIAIQIARWAVMGAQALVHAAKVAAAWLISLGPIAVVVAAVVGAATLIIKNWDKIKEWAVKIFGAVVDFLKKLPGRIIGAISALASTVFDFVVKWHPLAVLWRFISDNWGKVKTWFSELPGRIKDAVVALSTTVLEFIKEWHPLAIIFRLISENWGKVKTWFTELPGKIVSAIGKAGEILFDVGKKILEGLVDGAEAIIGWVLSRFGALPGVIIGAIGDAGKILFDVGKKIIEGLVEGARQAFNAKRSFWEGLGNKIAEWKGPLPVDKKLLIPAGQGILEGLVKGAEARMGLVRRTFEGVGDLASVSASVGMSGPGRAPGLSSVSGGSAAGGGAVLDTRPIVIQIDGDTIAEVTRRKFVNLGRGTTRVI